jgi:hypothetical protein
VLADARRQTARLAPHLPSWRIADWLRRQEALIQHARRRASTLGDTEAAWQLLAAVARAEDRVRVVGAAFDAF